MKQHPLLAVFELVCFRAVGLLLFPLCPTMLRGRGTLNVGESSNPFYQTNKGLADKILIMAQQGATVQSVPENAGKAEHVVSEEAQRGVVDFRYRTSSQHYGTKTQKSGNKLAEAMDQPAVQPAGSCVPTHSRSYVMKLDEVDTKKTIPSWEQPDRVDRLATQWRQEKAPQHPMYATR